jgi:branched-chain amino acid transport system substrate-binding protein
MNQYIIMYAMRAAAEKAGAFDTEKIIDALEGMTLDTFVGKIPIRAYDHQAMMPTWYGFVDFSKEVTFPHIPKPLGMMGEESYHTIDQIKKLRGGK